MTAYNYAAGDPINHSDPSGNSAASKLAWGLGAVATGIGVVALFASAPLSVPLGAVAFSFGGPAVALGPVCEFKGCD